MSVPTFNPNASVELAVAASAASFATTLVPTMSYGYACTVDSWITQGPALSTPTASAGAGSMFVPAGTIVGLDGALGDTVSAIRQGGFSGLASLTPTLNAKLGRYP